MDINKTKTITIESNDDFDRVRTYINDEDTIRNYYISSLDTSTILSGIQYLLDMSMDINLLLLDTLINNETIQLTDNQKANLAKLNSYHSFLKSVSLETAQLEMDWTYKIKQDIMIKYIEFFQKRSELDIPLVVK